MDYRIEIEEFAAQRIVHTSIKGVMSESERNRIAVETTGIMKENQLSKILWDIRETQLDYSLIGSHTVIMNLEALGLKRDNFVAVIYFHNQEQHEHAKITARNRGILNIGYFMNILDGIQWLLATT